MKTATGAPDPDDDKPFVLRSKIITVDVITSRHISTGLLNVPYSKTFNVGSLTAKNITAGTLTATQINTNKNEDLT